MKGSLAEQYTFRYCRSWQFHTHGLHGLMPSTVRKHRHLFEEESTGPFNRLIGRKAKTSAAKRATIQSLLDELLKTSEILLGHIEDLNSMPSRWKRTHWPSCKGRECLNTASGDSLTAIGVNCHAHLSITLMFPTGDTGVIELRL